MTDFIRVTPDFAVAPQLERADIARAAAEGFKSIVNNRPDHEQPGQLSSADAEAEAVTAGLAYRAIPFAGPPPMEAVAATEAWLAADKGPVLAFCRSGTRSITAWALAQAKAKLRTPDDIIQLAAQAGYDLSPHRVTLQRLASG